MAGAQDWQAPLTSPNQPPRNSFHFPPDPQNLTSLVRQTLRPFRSRKVVEMWKLMWCWCTVAEVCLEWDKESLPCQESCACVEAAPRGTAAGGGGAAAIAGLARRPSPSHAILLSLRLRVNRDLTNTFSPNLEVCFSTLQLI